MSDLHTVTLEQLRKLHPLTKRDLLRYFHSKLEPILNHADAIAQQGYSVDDVTAALAIARAVRGWKNELVELLKENGGPSHG